MFVCSREIGEVRALIGAVLTKDLCAAKMDEAKVLADQLGFELQAAATVAAPETMAGALQLELYFDRCWHVRRAGDKHGITLDFEYGSAMVRVASQSLSRERLVRAVLGRQLSASEVSVVDATAGLGRDSLMLAAVGCRVQLVERHPLLAGLLESAVTSARYSKQSILAAAALRMHVAHGDSCQWLLQRESPPDVVYLDPMFEFARGSAASKKEMTFLKLLHAGDSSDNDAALLNTALRVAVKRVVVKRIPSAAWLAGEKPSYVLEGKTVRFDVYVLASER